jgi:hypothetical protein
MASSLRYLGALVTKHSCGTARRRQQNRAIRQFSFQSLTGIRAARANERQPTLHGQERRLWLPTGHRHSKGHYLIHRLEFNVPSSPSVMEAFSHAQFIEGRAPRSVPVQGVATRLNPLNSMQTNISAFMEHLAVVQTAGGDAVGAYT